MSRLVCSRIPSLLAALLAVSITLPALATAGEPLAWIRFENQVAQDVYQGQSYLWLGRTDIASAADWIDSEIKDMWGKQRPDGVIEGWHGDGNSARTSIMYALWKTQGITVRPWRADVRFGTVRHGDTLCISLTADKPWSGKLLFDKPRHKQNMGLPLDYPRINQFPEWFTADAEQTFSVQGLSGSGAATYSGSQLQDGVAVELKPGEEVRLVVEERGGGGEEGR